MERLERAIRAGRLDEFLRDDVAPLIEADPEWLFPMLDDSRCRWARLYRTAAHPDLREQFSRAGPDTRRWLLQIHAARHDVTGERFLESEHDAWRAVWAHGMQSNGQVRPAWDNQTGDVQSVGLGTLDGRPVAVTGGDNGVLRVWDARTARPLRETRMGQYAVLEVTLADNVVLARYCNYTNLSAWDPATEGRRAESVPGIPEGGAQATVKEGGRHLVLTLVHDGVHVRDRRRAWRVRHGAMVNGMSTIRLDGRRRIVTCGDDGTVQILDLRTGERYGEPLTGHDGPVLAVATAHVAGRPLAVTAGRDDTMRIWDLRTRRQRGRSVPGRVTVLTTTEVDGRPVAVAGATGRRARVWDLRTGREWGEPLGEVGRGLTTMGQLAVTCGSNGIARVWDLRTRRSRTLLGPPRVGAVALGVAYGRPVVVYAREEGCNLTLMDLADGRHHRGGEAGRRLPHSMELTGGYTPGRRRSLPITAVATATVEDRCVIVGAGGDDGLLRVWDTAKFGEPRILHGPPGIVNALATTGSIVVSGGADGMVGIWDLRGDKSRAAVSPCPVDAVAVTGRTILTGGSDGKTRLWDVRTGERRGSLPTGMVNAIAAEGDLALVAGADLRLWDLREGGSLPLEGHTGMVTAVAIRGRQAVSGGWDRTLRTWDLRTGRQTAPPAPFPWPVSALAWHPDGRLVVGFSWEIVVLEPRRPEAGADQAGGQPATRRSSRSTASRESVF